MLARLDNQPSSVAVKLTEWGWPAPMEMMEENYQPAAAAEGQVMGVIGHKSVPPDAVLVATVLTEVLVVGRGIAEGELIQVEAEQELGLSGEAGGVAANDADLQLVQDRVTARFSVSDQPSRLRRTAGLRDAAGHDRLRSRTWKGGRYAAPRLHGDVPRVVLGRSSHRGRYSCPRSIYDAGSGCGCQGRRPVGGIRR